MSRWSGLSGMAPRSVPPLTGAPPEPAELELPEPQPAETASSSTATEIRMLRMRHLYVVRLRGSSHR